MAEQIQWGSPGTPTPFPISEEARTALKAQEIEVGDHLMLYLKKATGREREKFEKRLGRITLEAEQRELVADLMLARMAEGTNRRIVQEVLRDADDTMLNQLQFAYLNGEVPDPKAIEAATEGVIQQNTTRVLSGLAPNSRPSLPRSTASARGKSRS